jgi:hypothetical protein
MLLEAKAGTGEDRKTYGMSHKKPFYTCCVVGSGV